MPEARDEIHNPRTALPPREDNDICDERGQPVFQVDGKALSLRNVMIVNDMNGTEVARVPRKLISALAQFEVELAGRGTAVVHRKLSNPFKPEWRVTLEGQPEMELEGDVLGRNFTIQRGGTAVATVSKQWVTLASTYGVDVAQGEDDLLVLCTVLALEVEQERR